MKESYLPLYRKYRPQKLEDIVGQAHIKTALANAIKLDKISHAYLFTGPRGTGKTSTARILAKSLNCINGPTINPCGECESCKAVTNSVPIDVIEIDAASNRSVEDAHNILEKVQYAPVQGKYKIYIIDEVHMLTPQAFNALLKTLEEPPKNVIFILATTESHKVLDTIKSRCQRFDFKRITTNDIVEHLEKISKLENIKITKEALTTIAKLSAGGMRDSLALLDQASALGGDKELTEQDINNLLGRLSFDTLVEMANYIINSDSISSINLLDKIYNDGNEPIIILNNLMAFFKNILISTTCDLEKSIELTSLNEAQVKILTEYKSKVETHQILSLINKMADYLKEIKQTNYQQMWLEIALIDLSNLTNNTKLEDLQRRLQALEGGSTISTTVSRVVQPVVQPVQHVQSAQTVVQSVQSKPIANQTSSTSEPVENEVQNIDPQPVQQPQQPVQSTPSQPINVDTANSSQLWGQILSNIPDIPSQAWLKRNAIPAEITKERVILVIQKKDWVDRFNASDRRKIVIDAASVVLGNIDIQVIARTPQKDDIKIEVPKSKPQKKNIVKPENIEPEQEVVSQDEIESIDESRNEEKKEKDVEDETHSDQSVMIKDLFDGKYIV